jgi:hypothetical protein
MRVTKSGPPLVLAQHLNDAWREAMLREARVQVVRQRAFPERHQRAPSTVHVVPARATWARGSSPSSAVSCTSSSVMRDSTLAPSKHQADAQHEQNFRCPIRSASGGRTRPLGSFNRHTSCLLLGARSPPWVARRPPVAADPARGPAPPRSGEEEAKHLVERTAPVVQSRRAMHRSSGNTRPAGAECVSLWRPR